MDKHEIFVRAFVILGLGAAGIYLMLPRIHAAGHWSLRWVGSVLATFSLVLLATIPGSAAAGNGAQPFLWALDSGGASLTFYLLAGITLASGVMTITSRNPVYAALWFALVLLANSGLYLLTRAEFLAAATVIIYAGAIIVTFLFVIMLAQPAGTAPYDRLSREPFFACISGALLAGALVGTIHYSSTAERAVLPVGGAATFRPQRDLVELVLVRGTDKTRSEVNAGSWKIDTDKPHTHVEGLGRSLFLDHFVSVEVIGVLLLVAVVGAMIIAGHTPPLHPMKAKSADVRQ